MVEKVQWGKNIVQWQQKHRQHHAKRCPFVTSRREPFVLSLIHQTPCIHQQKWRYIILLFVVPAPHLNYKLPHLKHVSVFIHLSQWLLVQIICEPAGTGGPLAITSFFNRSLPFPPQKRKKRISTLPTA
ncbi:hypothetical protein, unlikely [Trypanosoma brucei gambiense DAL972]|uniref:Uncharacterized protein n=1 Tax=Trypanosoma brucei gambiense (strain MHOM/CI/86/DAL972) TaxID=679716 RepID=C9ZJI1_TRYB9|nr:hypothetical protein, unlikely [Trypanosoma brucei gambiense DAL972]CBH09540.1 hypothetical protein, unlikely [Trypanosoma brucei gambiense DAL972]|eukprot:XP_011771845.1 hypothetical protein, unlikely [Trypanosoma brucei gambiense DAL972]